MRLSVTDALVVAMTVLHKGQAVECKNAVVSDLTTGELFTARSQAKEREFWAVHEMAAKTKLIDAQGNQHQLTYEMLCDTSSSNFKKLEELDFELQLKLNAVSLESPSS